MLLSKQGYRLNEPIPLEKEKATNINQMFSAITNGLDFKKENISELFSWHLQEVERFFPLPTKEGPQLRVVK